METVSVREYRNNLALYFSKADNGGQVLIRRKNEIYALVKVGREDLILTHELQRRIDEVYKNYCDGKSVSCRNHDELNTLLDSL